MRIEKAKNSGGIKKKKKTRSTYNRDRLLLYKIMPLCPTS